MDALVAPPMKIEGYFTKHDKDEYYSPVRPSVAPPAESLRRLIQESIREIARRGKVVIVAHAASLVLAHHADTLRVLVTASVKTRAQRVYFTGKLLDEDESARAVADSDRERQRYLERFFDVRQELPTHYDLVINTDVLRLEQSVAAIVAAAKA
jgi:cytidylate kinase